LFTEEQLGRDKLDAARESLTRLGDGRTEVVLVRERFLPDNARRLAAGVDVVVEGADNFATKFLAADAAHLEAKPIVHGAGVRWTATAWCVAPEGAPCYRCLFEDVPLGAAQPNCAEAGVMGPVVGVAGALMADLALGLLSGRPAFGRIHTFEGKTDRLRAVALSARGDCPLCGPSPTISDIIEARYIQGICAA
jgi:molybdopterin/thiamine biosynthesis adenylyltransferase